MEFDQYAEEDEAVDLNENGFKFAFTVENFATKEVFNLPEHAKWMAII
jgi:hypothetical protein